MDWSGLELFLSGVACLFCLIFGMVIGAVINQKNVDRRIEKAQKEIISEIHTLKNQTQVEVDNLVTIIEKYLKGGN